VHNIERWNKKFSEQVFVVAELENNIVGFSSIYINHYIDYLYVSHLHQGKGIATLLVDFIEKLAKHEKAK